VKRSWPFLNTPTHVYLGVMGSICGLMIWAFATDYRIWVRGSAVVVIACSLYGWERGYGRRLSVDESGVEFRTWWVRRRMSWRQVRRIDRYIPSGGVNGARYVYLTARDRPPEGRHQIDAETFQLQDRPELLDALRTGWAAAAADQGEGAAAGADVGASVRDE